MRFFIYPITKLPNYQISQPFPHKRIKAAASLKAQAAVELHGLGIGLRHGQAQTKEAAAAQLLRAESNERFTNPAAAMFRQNANLGHVANVFTDTRTQQQT